MQSRDLACVVRGECERERILVLGGTEGFRVAMMEAEVQAVGSALMGRRVAG